LNLRARLGASTARRSVARSELSELLEAIEYSVVHALGMAPEDLAAAFSDAIDGPSRPSQQSGAKEIRQRPTDTIAQGRVAATRETFFNVLCTQLELTDDRVADRRCGPVGPVLHERKHRTHERLIVRDRHEQNPIPLGGRGQWGGPANDDARCLHYGPDCALLGLAVPLRELACATRRTPGCRSRSGAP
jgi:hypothetical protein